jgi:predicted RecB family nuclease
VTQPAIFLDLETSFDCHDDPWLIGLLLPDQKKPIHLMELDLQRHAGQVLALGQILARYPGLPIYHWGHFDRTALRRTHARLQLPLPDWLQSERWFHLTRWLKSTLVLPARGHGLKEVASYFELPWRHTELDGQVVGMWYTAFRERGRQFDVERVREYNEDDVLAMVHTLRRARELLHASPREMSERA